MIYAIAQIATNKDMPLEITQDDATGLPHMPWHWLAGGSPDTAWQDWARAIHAHWQTQQVRMADAVVLLPQIALLNVARQAWAQAVEGWIPRFETVGTLLDRLPQDTAETSNAVGGHPPLTLDACLDALLVAARLRSEASGRQWARRDPGGFDFAVTRMLEFAHQWLKAALSLRPEARQRMVDQAEAWMSQALSKTQTGDQEDPRAREQVLTAMALSWAMEALPSLAPRRDPVFSHRPSAWVAVTLGQALVPGSESCLMSSVLQQAMACGLPVLWTPAAMAPSTGALAMGMARPELALCIDGEDEARRTAAHVLARLADQRRAAQEAGAQTAPLALIAMDRVVTRRVRALLAPSELAGQLVVHDESGWTLSTTRAATVVTRALGAASPSATTDDVLDWLSSAWVSSPGGAHALAGLERVWRTLGRMQPWQAMDTQATSESGLQARALQAWAEQTLAPLRDWAAGKVGALQDALEALRQVLEASGAMAAMAPDPAGQSVLTALRLSDEGLKDAASSEALWRRLSETTRLTWSEWTRWVDQTLEASTFMPEGSGQAPDVVIAPLSRAVLRSFSKVVLPGADESMLGAKGGDGWLSPADASALGLGSASLQQQAQWEAFTVLVNQAPMLALHRHIREGEPVGPSPWLSRWSLASGWPLGQDQWPEPMAQLVSEQVEIKAPALPVPHLPSAPTSAAQADALWPERVSASAYERLRECPYRYFALSLLGLKTLDELEEGVGRQDQGIWLHAVLKRFHEGRPPELAPALETDDVARWLEVAQALAQEQGLSSDTMRAHFLPYQTTLQSLAEHYVHWLRQHEQRGWRVASMEESKQTELPLFTDDAGHAAVSLQLYGQLDRVDERPNEFPDAQGRQAWVVDYKTGSLQSLKRKVSQPMEDTQLAFYALLTEGHESVNASYLHLDDRACTDLAHEDVETTAQALSEGMRQDFERIWMGHAMPALGEGSVCDFCDARGLCRKDHWAAGPGRPADAQEAQA